MIQGIILFLDCFEKNNLLFFSKYAVYAYTCNYIHVNIDMYMR